MVLPKLDAPGRADLSRWTAHGMRASATGAVDFTGVEIEPMRSSAARETMSDSPGFRPAHGVSPRFISAAWRGCSISFGGIYREPIADKIRTRPRVGPSRDGMETARLWVARLRRSRSSFRMETAGAACRLRRSRAPCGGGGGSRSHALVHRSVGLQAFMRPNPIERISRDLATYLRQPGPDRALTNAAAWMLARPAGAQNLWR